MKRKPQILIFLLFLILAFILGFRSGQQTEKTNEAIDYVLSITPTPKPPSPTPVKYSEYKSKKWGLEFTFPSGLAVKESTNSPKIIFEMPGNP